ncbi:ankyrin repeat-containing domain protein [Xylaria arbuscula]|nr:ankyrin repeat-containing domain protein [Xylaria arbuscula]
MKFLTYNAVPDEHMGLIDLPVEVLEIALAFLVPNHWNKTQALAECLELRLVCRQFDDVVSRHALGKLDQEHLIGDSWDLSNSSINWLLATKLKADRGSQTTLAASVWNAALLWASRYGSFEFTKLLLSRHDIDPNIRKYNGYTPLAAAVIRGHEGIVRLLVERDDLQPRFGGGKSCPLWSAVIGGHEKILELFLEQYDIQLDDYGLDGTSLLRRAAREGEKEIVRLLLERGNANPNISDPGGYTPLFSAMEGGHDAVVRLLIARGDVNPNLGPDFHGTLLTPLGAAIRRGNEAIVQLLLERDDTDPNKQDIGCAPLCIAAAAGEIQIVRLLLERSDINLNITDREGNTALWNAVAEGHQLVSELLLARKDVDPNDNNIDGTPLWQAARFGQDSVMRPWLDRPDIYRNLLLEEYNGILLTPTRSRCGLPERTYRFLNRSGRSGQESPLGVASRKGMEVCVQLLLQQHRIDPNRVDGSGYGRPLSQVKLASYSIF